MGEPLNQPAKLFLPAMEGKGSSGITPDNYQNLPPSSHHIYNFVAGDAQCGQFMAHSS